MKMGRMWLCLFILLIGCSKQAQKITAPSLAQQVQKPPHPSACLAIDLNKVDENHYEQYAVNMCDVGIPQAAVLVKFFNANWERVGVGGYAMFYVAPHEKLRKVFKADADVVPFTHVGVRAITDRAADVLR